MMKVMNLFYLKQNKTEAKIKKMQKLLQKKKKMIAAQAQADEKKAQQEMH